METLPTAGRVVAYTLTIDDWNRERPTIGGLRAENTLAQIMATMKARGFVATENQYKKKFAEWRNTKYEKRREKRTADSVPGRENGKRVMTAQLPKPGGNGQAERQSTVLGDMAVQPSHTHQPSSGNDSPNAISIHNVDYASCSDTLGIQGTIGISTAGDVEQISGYMNSEQGHQDIVKILLEKGANVEATDIESQRRPIHQAAQNGHLETLQLLLKHGADPDSKESDGATPLWLAAQNGHKDVKVLLNNNANPNAQTIKTGRSPMHQAVQNGHHDVLALLIQHDANVNAVEEDGWTPMMMAAQQGHIEVINLLLKSHADIHIEEKDHATAIWLAAQQGHVDCVKIFLENKANPSQVTKSGRQPLHQAAQNGHLEVIKLLVQNNAEVDSAAHQGHVTPLWLAAQGGYTEIVEYLFEKGASLAIQTQQSSVV